MGDLNIENTTEHIGANLPNQHKMKKLTKAAFCLMAILLLATTAISSYTGYNMYLLNKKLNASNTVNANDSDNTDSSLIVPDGHTLISNEDFETAKNDSYYLGRDNLLSSIRSMMENGDTTLKMLRALYPNQLIYNQTNGFIFKDINTSLAMNDYNTDGFKIIENEYSVPTSVEYYEDDVLVSYAGIDVSKHNGTIDWKKVSESGIDFAIIRAGNRGYGAEGKLLTDDKFAENATAATENGIAIGAYIFSEAITIQEAIEEAELILNQIEPFDITYPIVIDIEEIANDTGRNESLTPTELTDIVLAFCDHIKNAGYTPMIYGNLKGLIGMLEFERLEGIEKWYAYYGNELYFPYDVSIWQYSASGIVPGVEGVVDLNISFKNYK